MPMAQLSSTHGFGSEVAGLGAAETRIGLVAPERNGGWGGCLRGSETTVRGHRGPQILDSERTTICVWPGMKPLTHTSPMGEGPWSHDGLPEATGLKQLVPGPGHLLSGK